MKTENAITVNDIRESLVNDTQRSAWDKGVTAYALDLLDGLQESIDCGALDSDDLIAPKVLHKALLNGAGSWSEYSWGGCSLICDSDIAERLCTPSELKRTRNGERRPNSREEWLDTQARALFQAANRIVRRVRMLAEEAAA